MARAALRAAANPGATGCGAGGGPSPGISGDRVATFVEWDDRPRCASRVVAPSSHRSRASVVLPLRAVTPCGGAAPRPQGLSVMVGPSQPRVVVGSPRPRVIVGAIRPRVIVGSARTRAPPDATPRPQLAAGGSPRPRVVFGTPGARVIVGSPRPGVIVSSPWPAVVVASPRPRAPTGSPWPRVIVGTPRPRIIVGSPRVPAAGADRASAPSRGAPQGRRQDEHSGARAEGPRPGGAAPGRHQGHVGPLAVAECGRGEGGTGAVGLSPALSPCEARYSWVVRFPPHPQPRAAWLWHKSSILTMSLSVPEEGGRFARAQRLPPPRHLRLPGAPDRHRGVS